MAPSAKAEKGRINRDEFPVLKTGRMPKKKTRKKSSPRTKRTTKKVAPLDRGVGSIWILTSLLWAPAIFYFVPSFFTVEGNKQIRESFAQSAQTLTLGYRTFGGGGDSTTIFAAAISFTVLAVAIGAGLYRGKRLAYGLGILSVLPCALIKPYGLYAAVPIAFFLCLRMLHLVGPKTLR